MFIAPVICCFIGLGALLNMLVSIMHEEQKAIAEEVRSNDEEADGLEDSIIEIQKGCKSRQDRISQGKEEVKPISGIRESNARLNISLEELKKRLQEASDESERLSAECDLAREKKEEERKNVSVTTIGGTQKNRHLKPVFVECASQKAILQPQAKELSSNPDKSDQEAFLDFARRTGYVVFLIRPDGFGCFENYRDLMISANKNARSPVEYGYEPVNADWNLIYPGKEG